jgi:hypothetical protein
VSVLPWGQVMGQKLALMMETVSVHQMVKVLAQLKALDLELTTGEMWGSALGLMMGLKMEWVLDLELEPTTVKVWAVKLD